MERDHRVALADRRCDQPDPARARKRRADLDIEVETGLAAYDGALLVVSHDPAFREAIGITRTIELTRIANNEG